MTDHNIGKLTKRHISDLQRSNRRTICERETLERISAWECTYRLQEITSMATASGTHFSHSFSTLPTPKPFQCVFQVTTMATAWTPHKHTLHRLVAYKTHSHFASTIFAHFTRTRNNLIDSVASANGISGLLQRLSTSWASFVDSVRERRRRHGRITNGNVSLHKVNEFTHPGIFLVTRTLLIVGSKPRRLRRSSF